MKKKFIKILGALAAFILVAWCLVTLHDILSIKQQCMYGVL